MDPSVRRFRPGVERSRTRFAMSPGAAQNQNDLPAAVDAIAAALEKGDSLKAEQLAKAFAIAQGEVYYVMLLFKPRDKRGFGVGGNPGAVKPDGIEIKIRELAKGPLPPAQLQQETEALTKLAYRTMAVALCSAHLPPRVRDRDLWVELAKTGQQRSLDFLAAVQTAVPANVQASAAALNASCNACHGKFR